MLKANIWPRIFVLSLVMGIFGYAWQQLNELTLYVVGQPSSVGPLQSKMEAPFFTALRQKSKLPLDITYKPLNETGLIDAYQLQTLQDGVIDLVSLRFIQNSKVEPALAGIDLPGLIQDFDTARRVTTNYAPTLDHYLQGQHNVKLLGLWTFGPQQIFCKTRINNIKSFSGMKIRIPSSFMSPLISKLGGIPAVISFDETKQALAIGLVDCAITSIASANSAGWTEYTPYYIPLAFGFGINGYAISMKKWNELSSRQQATFQKSINSYLNDHWKYSKQIYINARECSTLRVCQDGKSFPLIEISPSKSDITFLQNVSRATIKKSWASQCELIHHGCLSQWEKVIGSILQSKIF